MPPKRITALWQVSYAQAVAVAVKAVQSSDHVLKESKGFAPVAIAICAREIRVVRDKERIRRGSQNVLDKRRLSDSRWSKDGEVSAGRCVDQRLQLIRCRVVLFVRYFWLGKPLDEAGAAGSNTDRCKQVISVDKITIGRIGQPSGNSLMEAIELLPVVFPVKGVFRGSWWLGLPE
jgi:hypothetical protein